MKHEFGHIFGAPDYYSYSDTHEAAIATFDMMCNSSSDHNGFTKWLFGWLSNDDIAYVSKATGDTTVSLAPFETSLGDGKKIARDSAFFTSMQKRGMTIRNSLRIYCHPTTA